MYKNTVCCCTIKKTKTPLSCGLPIQGGTITVTIEEKKVPVQKLGLENLTAWPLNR